jgi:Spy/CpxP family protein refolding chaperone
MDVSISGVATPFADPTDTSGTTSPNLRAFADLGLTETQRTQIRSILHQAKQNGTSATDVESQIDGVLTDAQKAQLASAASAATSGGAAQQAPPPGPPNLFAGITLTSDQQSQIHAILHQARSTGESRAQVNAQIESVLTGTQKTTFEQNLQNAQASDPGRFGDGSSSGSSSSTVASTGTSSSESSASGTTESDVQQQAAAALSIILNQLRHEATDGTSGTQA